MHIIKQLSVSLRHITKQFINLSAFFHLPMEAFLRLECHTLESAVIRIRTDLLILEKNFPLLIKTTTFLLQFGGFESMKL